MEVASAALTFTELGLNSASSSVFISDLRADVDAGGLEDRTRAVKRRAKGNRPAYQFRCKLRRREHLSNLDEFLLIPYLIGVSRTGRADCCLFNPALKSKGTSDVGVLEKRATDGEL